MSVARAPRANGCAALVEAVERAALARPAPREFLRHLGRVGAGIRPGPAGLVDLARAGSDGFPGRGFRAELDDGTDGQARHFCGIAVCCDRFGARATRWVSIHLRLDPPDEPDGRLTDLAIEFVGRLNSGELAVADAGGWLRETLCEPDAVPGPEVDEAGPGDVPA